MNTQERYSININTGDVTKVEEGAGVGNEHGDLFFQNCFVDDSLEGVNGYHRYYFDNNQIIIDIPVQDFNENGDVIYKMSKYLNANDPDGELDMMGYMFKHSMDKIELYMSRDFINSCLVD